MTALSKLLVLIAIFLLPSHANVNQVQEKHWFQFEEPMKDPTNEPSCEPSHEPTKRMDLDAELPSNLSSKRVNFSLSKNQDAELPSKIIDTQNTQTRGLCHDKKSGPESLVEQQIAVTNSSQRGLCHGKKSELESLTEQPIAATDSSQYNLPAGLGVLGLRSAKTINLPAEPWLALSKLLKRIASRPWLALSKLYIASRS
jgi:hypothetical protein